MTKRLKIQIFPNGTIHAETEGIKGTSCTDYIRMLEEMLEAEATESSYTPEYYEPEELTAEQGEVGTVHTSRGD